MIGRELLARLSEREREILALILEGNSTKEVADACGTSVKTVETQRTAINRKLGAAGNDGLLRLAVIKGWVEVRRKMDADGDWLGVLFDYQRRDERMNRGPVRRAS